VDRISLPVNHALQAVPSVVTIRIVRLFVASLTAHIVCNPGPEKLLFVKVRSLWIALTHIVGGCSTGDSCYVQSGVLLGCCPESVEIFALQNILT
jgi:hypothetical protein